MRHLERSLAAACDASGDQFGNVRGRCRRPKSWPNETDRSDYPVETQFDYVTIACFLAMAGAFFMLTARQPRTLLHLLVAGSAFAIANQLGNAGDVVLALILIIGAMAYSVIIIWQG
jgi:hypothetical protein